MNQVIPFKKNNYSKLKYESKEQKKQKLKIQKK